MILSGETNNEKENKIKTISGNCTPDYEIVVCTRNKRRNIKKHT
jgi:hypothetical protein